MEHRLSHLSPITYHSSNSPLIFANYEPSADCRLSSPCSVSVFRVSVRVLRIPYHQDPTLRLYPGTVLFLKIVPRTGYFKSLIAHRSFLNFSLLYFCSAFSNSSVPIRYRYRTGNRYRCRTGGRSNFCSIRFYCFEDLCAVCK